MTRKKAKCRRDGIIPVAALNSFVDNKKLKLDGPPWSPKICYDCQGVHKYLKICLDCLGRDINDPNCYDCEKNQEDMKKKFCICKKDPTSKICFDC